jgi:hypothetical protein
MLWKIKKIPVMYVILVILMGAFVFYFFENYKVSDDQAQTKEEENQLSLLGADTTKLANQPDSATTLSKQQTNQSTFGPQAPTAKPTPTPKPSPTSSPSPTPETASSPTPEPSPNPPPPPGSPPPPPADPPPPPASGSGSVAQ